MASSKKDASEPIRERASRYPGVGAGTACTQSSYKIGKKAFLFIGMQGGRHKAMFKLKDSLAQATKLADENPDGFQVGSTAWVTARFTDDRPLPKRLWQAWLDESYALSQPATKQAPGGAKRPTKAKDVKRKASKAKATKRPAPLRASPCLHRTRPYVGSCRER